MKKVYWYIIGGVFIWWAWKKYNNNNNSNIIGGCGTCNDENCRKSGGDCWDCTAGGRKCVSGDENTIVDTISEIKR